MSFTSNLNNMRQMLAAIQNPQQVLSEQVMRQLIQENPQVWQQAEQLVAGKSHAQQVAELQKLYKSKGLDLASTAAKYGVVL